MIYIYACAEFLVKNYSFNEIRVDLLSEQF